MTRASYAALDRKYKTRRPGHKNKTIDRGVFITLNDDDVFDIWFANPQWVKQPNGDYKRQNNPQLLATMTPTNILTLRYEGKITQTLCNRFSDLLGLPMSSNKAQYRNYKQHIRIYHARTVHGSIDWKTSVPYFVGAAWDMNGMYAQLTNPEPDVKIAVKTDAVVEARRQFDSLRKLAKVSERIGALNDVADKFVTKPWDARREFRDKVKALAAINVTDPVFDDVLAVLVHGAMKTESPSGMQYDNATKRYLPVPIETRRSKWINRALFNGFAELRNVHYAANDAFKEVAA